MKDILILAAACVAIYLSPVSGFIWNVLIGLGAGCVTSFVLEL